MMHKFRCSYCNKSYARESWYRKHVCEKRKRFEEAHNMDFLRGMRMYEHWWRRNGFPLRRGEHLADDKFIKSPLYKTFMALVKFTTDNWVITSLRYVDYIIDSGVPEAKWMSEETLRQYRDHTRRHEDPVKQTKITCEAVKTWCEKHQIDTREFFTKVTPGSALQMVVNNQISPWVLFGYDRAVNELLTRVNDDWLHSINEYLNNTYWINKIKSSPDTKQVVQHECERMFGE